MKHITIVVPEGNNNLSSITGAYEIFNKANAYRKGKGKKEIFTIQLAGISPAIDFNGGIFKVIPHISISEITRTDLIIIPSLNHNYELALTGNSSLLTWLVEHYKKGAELATICTGAFMLAATGLLEGKSCSTHWAVTENFRNRFPNIHLQADKIITDENGIYTNGGAYSFLNLMIYLVEKYYDRETALYCAKTFQIDISRDLQGEFAIFNGHKKHDDKMVLQAQDYFEDHYPQKISIEVISEKYHVGRRNFDRRFVKATGLSPLDYLQRVRIEAAKKLFESTRKNVTEVMYEVGYNDVKAFREVFSRVTGLSPVGYRSKYNKEGKVVS